MQAGSDNDLGINGISAIEPHSGLPAIWVEEKDKEIAETYGYTVVSPSAVISTHLTEVIKKNSAEIVSRADIQQLIDNLKKEVSEEYVSDLMKDLTVAEVQQIVYNLLKERVSVRDLKTILEVLSLQSRVSKNADYLTEQVRPGVIKKYLQTESGRYRRASGCYACALKSKTPLHRVSALTAPA